mgnify:CR=1 FL=1
MPVQRRETRQVIDNYKEISLGGIVLPSGKEGDFLVSRDAFGFTDPKPQTGLITATQVGTYVISPSSTVELGPLTTSYTGPDVSFDLSNSRFTINTPGTYTVHIQCLLTYPVGVLFGGRIISLSTLSPSPVSRSFVQATQPISGGVFEFHLSATFVVATIERYRILTQNLDTGFITTVSDGVVDIYKHLV